MQENTTTLAGATAMWLRTLPVYGYAAHTVSNYTRDLRQFCDFATLRLGHEAGLAECTRDLIAAHLAELRARLAPASVERHLFCFRAFWKFADRSGLASDPMEKMLRPRISPQRLARFLSEKEAAALMAGASPTRRDASALRDRAIVETLYSTGIRVSELTHLDWRDIESPDSGFVLVRSGKSDKDRIVPIGEPALDAIRAWRNFLGDPTDLESAVFRNLRGGRLTTRAVESIVRDRGVAVGIERRIFPHMLRHTFATHLIRHGAGLADIATMLGHENFNTTARYTHLDLVYLRKNHRKLSRGIAAKETNMINRNRISITPVSSDILEIHVTRGKSFDEVWLRRTGDDWQPYDDFEAKKFRRPYASSVLAVVREWAQARPAELQEAGRRYWDRDLPLAAQEVMDATFDLKCVRNTVADLARISGGEHLGPLVPEIDAIMRRIGDISAELKHAQLAA